MQFRDRRLQLGQTTRVFLAAAAAEANQRHRLAKRLAKRILKCSVVNPRDIRIDPRRRMRLMHLQPFLSLTNAVVEKLGRHIPGAKRCDQLPPHCTGKLARVNRHFRRG